MRGFGLFERVGMMPGMLLAVVVLCVSAAVGQSAWANDGADVMSVRIGHDASKDSTRTRVVLDLSDKVPYRWFTLPKPARLVVDFQQDITFKEDPAGIALPRDGGITGVRAGRFRPGTVRMVMDLTKAAKISVFAIPADGRRPHRLVIDVMPPKRGEKPTNVPPPADVVTSDAAPVVKPSQTKANAKDFVETPPVVRTVNSQNDGKIIVTLDAGHGGVDPGALGRSYRTREKDITLAMAKKVRAALKDDRIQVVLTRDSDIFIPLPERGKIAQRANADLFVSLHADSAPNRDVTGATVYMVSAKASDREAQRLAKSENDGDVLAGIALDNETQEVQNILISLVQRDTMNNSSYLGQSILNDMDRVTTVRKKNLLFAGFRVLKTPDVPSVLIEMGYLSNPTEEKNLNDPDYQDKLAKAIAKGIMDYVNAYVHR